MKQLIISPKGSCFALQGPRPGIHTFNESQELFVFQFPGGHVNLQGQQQGEGHLVFLVQSSDGVLEHLICHVLDDVGDTFLCNWGFC